MFNWETVCFNHPYDEDVYLKQYDRTYKAPWYTAHDGVWVLVFVSSSGSPTYIWGSCKNSGANFIDKGKRCFGRENSEIILVKSDKCSSYEIVDTTNYNGN